MKMKIWLPVVILVAALGSTAYWYFQPREPASPPSLNHAPAPRVPALGWDELRAGLAGMDVLEIRQHGVRYFRAGDADKSFLLLKTAANRGDGWSALAVGQMYDPATFAAADFNPGMTAFSKPNPAKALQWYRRALDQGEPRAQPLYNALLADLRRAAEGGDSKAQRILKHVR